MTLDAFDYSYARPSPTAMVKAGIKVVGRYLFNSSKGMTDAERKSLHAAGLGIVLLYEGNAGNALLGANQGRADGNAARALAKSLGAPIGTPIVYACDRQILTSAQETAVMAYLHAADSPTYPAAVYGQASIVDAWYRQVKRPGFQTVAWSGGRISAHAALYQYEINQSWNGSQVDYCQILKADKLGAWWPEGKEPDDGELEVDGVKITKDELNKLIDERANTVARDWAAAITLGEHNGEATHGEYGKVVPSGPQHAIYSRLHALDGKDIADNTKGGKS